LKESHESEIKEKNEGLMKNKALYGAIKKRVLLKEQEALKTEEKF